MAAAVKCIDHDERQPPIGRLRGCPGRVGQRRRRRSWCDAVAVARAGCTAAGRGVRTAIAWM